MRVIMMMRDIMMLMITRLILIPEKQLSILHMILQMINLVMFR